MSAGATTILVVRHGETDWNKQHRLQGQSALDPPLNDLGELQASALAQQLQSEPLQAVYSSDLRRAMQTAEAIAGAKGLQVGTTAQLRERSLGVLEGMTHEEAPQLQPDAWRCLRSSSHAMRIPGGGESADDVMARVAAAVNAIANAHPGQRVLLVAHGGVIHALYRHVMGRPYHDRIVNGAVGILKVERGVCALISWNDTTHVRAVGFMGQAFGGGEGGA